MATAVIGGAVILTLVAGLIFAEPLALSGAGIIMSTAKPPDVREPPQTSGDRPYSSDDVQVIGGRGEGIDCSVPWLASALVLPPGAKGQPLVLEMRQACVTHDYCYRHGAATYDYTQADCDRALLDQALKQCVFIVSKEEVDNQGPEWQACLNRARLMSLGVTFGGSGAFRTAELPPDRGPHEVGSSYFDYDPYPLKSASYHIYRIADAPADGPTPKALYDFWVRPSGMIVDIYSLSATGPLGKARVSYELDGNPNFLTTAPLVMRAGNGEDWLIWWRRETLLSTKGQLVGIAPGRATTADWACLGGRRPQADCRKVRAPLLDLKVGYSDLTEADPNLSELLPVPGVFADGDVLRFMARPQHGCNAGGNALCFALFDIDLKHTFGVQRQDQLIARDSFSKAEEDVSKFNEELRYGNFVAMPIASQWPGAAKPSLMWFRSAKDFKHETILRRLAVVPRSDGHGLTGGTEGYLRLKGFTQGHDPAFLLGRHTDHPVMAAFVTKDSDFHLDRWPLPAPEAVDRDKGILVEPLDDAAIFSGLDASWLIRPPVVVTERGESTIYFSRVTWPDEGPGLTLEWSFWRVGSGGMPVRLGCGRMSERAESESAAGQAPLTASETQNIASGPFMVVDLDGDGTREFVVPYRRDGGGLGAVIHSMGGGLR
ncbi:hypothetical protein [Zavarzinia aquatilis]|uniref:Uncharacterized protein n=1 Tax=Zavarzinia aquatilis TaxID=2211142 RepID=A0A317EDM0_9PROT|nr:hypothetical protein [Zavarzinia aquatilis]PWR25019.1 hypothetical protein DKG74_04425 [Zavarzinia aquatilis]